MTWLSNDAVERLRDVAARPELPSGRYAILRPIGRGGMGIVYAARDTELDRDVAIKVSSAAGPASAPDLEARLEREARVLARLEHPGIVPVHDAGVLADGRRFYVMKLVQGETLARHASALTNEAARLGVFERICETVAFAHAAGVVHRDLTPSNVMVGRFGEVLVLDWGVARVVGDAAEDGVRMGTAGFMAPEQARGEGRDAGPAADVYALGALLFWLFAGAAPPLADGAAAARLKALTPPVPRRLRAVAVRCLATSPDARYAGAAALVEDLARYREGRPVSAHREGPFERAWHWLARYRTFMLLVLAYLLMRALFALIRPFT